MPVKTDSLEYRTEYALREKPIVERLVRLRNELAHGGWQSIDPDEYEELYKEIDQLMGLLCDEIESAAATRRFKRTSSVKVAAR